jgi:lysophospholipase L1-like esterase
LHALDAQASGDPFPSIESLRGFGRDQYLYDRRCIYRWQHASLWNIAAPATVASVGLYQLVAHRERLRAFSPDAIVVCLGSVDCLEVTVKRNYADLTEMGAVQNLESDAVVTFDSCRSAETYRKVLTEIAQELASIGGETPIVHLDILAAPGRSRSQHARILEFTEVVHEVSRAFGHHLVTYPFLEGLKKGEASKWFRADDLHPTDEMNAKLAELVLEQLPVNRVHESDGDAFPVAVVDVTQWNEEA